MSKNPIYGWYGVAPRTTWNGRLYCSKACAKKAGVESPSPVLVKTDPLLRSLTNRLCGQCNDPLPEPAKR